MDFDIPQYIARISTESMAENEMPTLGEGSFLGRGRGRAVVLVMNFQAGGVLASGGWNGDGGG